MQRKGHGARSSETVRQRIEACRKRLRQARSFAEDRGGRGAEEQNLSGAQAALDERAAVESEEAMSAPAEEERNAFRLACGTRLVELAQPAGGGT